MSSSNSDTALRVLDVSGQELSKVSQFPKRQPLKDVAAVIADGNNLSTLHGIEQYPSLVQLSACDNSLVRMDEVAPLINLVTLNLQTNSIMDITGLEQLVNLQWLCLAGNSIKSMDGLSGNGHLNHLDLSDNCITELQDVTMLTQLKTLLLHGNAILSLKSVGQCLPSSVNTLTLAENEVTDLNEVSFLATLNLLTQLSFMSNPAVSISESTMFDYRPYMIYWCPGLTTLDGLGVTPEERQQSSILFPPNQPHPFALGEHWTLVQYLTSVCPLGGGMQTLVSTNMTANDVENINPNSQSALSTSLSLSGLEEALKTGGSDAMQKFKALQLVEQMISAQEQLLRSQHEENLNKDVVNASLENVLKPEAFDMKPTTAIHGLEEESSLKPDTSEQGHHHVSLDEKTTVTVSDSVQSDTTLSVDGNCVVYQTLPGEQSSTTDDSQAAKMLSLQERKQQQLKLLNEKLAQRHSKLPHKAKTSTTNKSTLKAGVKKAGTTARHVPKSQSSSFVTKGVSSAGSHYTKKNECTHRPDCSGGVATSKSTPTVSVSSFKSTINPSLQCTTSVTTTAEAVKNSIESITCDTSESGDVSQIADKKPQSVPTDDDDMLDSSSHYIPLPDDNNVLPFDFSDTDTLYDVSSLASSLTQAYGITHLKEHTQILSSLVGPAHIAEDTQHYTHVNDSAGIQTSSQTPTQTNFTHNSVSTVHDKDDSSPQCLLYAADTRCSDNEALNVCREDSAVKIQAVYRGYLTRKRLGLVLQQHKAATLIQATWRGYCARRHNPDVMRVRSELSRIKLEAYVATLYSQLQGCRQELAHQISVSQLQEETLQSLLVEVEGLRKWRGEIDTERRQKAAIVIQKHWRGYSARKKYHFGDLVLTSDSKALSSLCYSLKEEVKDIRKTLTVVLDKVQLLGETRQTSPKMKYSGAEMPPATDLTMSHFSSSCVLLRWTPASSPASLTTVLQGYRIYVNGVPEGMVGASKSRAYIEGLDRDTTYRITIRAVYNSGESCDSNPIVASLSSQKRGAKLNPSPPQITYTTTSTLPPGLNTTQPPSNTSEAPPLQQQSETTIESSTQFVDVSDHHGIDSLPQQHQSNGTNCHHTPDKPPSTTSHSLTDSNQSHTKSQGSSSYQHSYPVNNDDLVGNKTRKMTEQISLNEASTTAAAAGPMTHDDNYVTDHEEDNQCGLSMEDLPQVKHINDETVSVMSGATEEYISYTESSPNRDDTTLRNGSESLASGNDDVLSEVGSEVQEDKESQSELLLLHTHSPAQQSLQEKTQGAGNETTLTHLPVCHTLASSNQQQSGQPTSTTHTSSHTVVPHYSMVTHPSSKHFDEISSGCHAPTLMHNVVGHGHLQELTLATTRMPFEPDTLTTAHYYNTTTTTITTSSTTTTTTCTAQDNASVHTEVIRSASNTARTDCGRQDHLQDTVNASVSIPTPKIIPPKMLSSEQSTGIGGKFEIDSSVIEEFCKPHTVGMNTQDIRLVTNNTEVPLVKGVMISGCEEGSKVLECYSPVLLDGMENNDTVDSQATGDGQTEGEATMTDSASKETNQKSELGLLTTPEGYKMSLGTSLEVKHQESDINTHFNVEDQTIQHRHIMHGTSSSALLASQLLSQLEADLREARNT